METQTLNVDSWDHYETGSLWLKAAVLKHNPDTLVCVDVKGKIREAKNTLVLTVEYEKVQYQFELNLTNAKVVYAACPNSPKQLIGRKIVMERVKQQNPTTKQFVDSLNIIKIE